MDAHRRCDYTQYLPVRTHGLVTYREQEDPAPALHTAAGSSHSASLVSQQNCQQNGIWASPTTGCQPTDLHLLQPHPAGLFYLTLQGNAHQT